MGVGGGGGGGDADLDRRFDAATADVEGQNLDQQFDGAAGRTTGGGGEAARRAGAPGAPAPGEVVVAPPLGFYPEEGKVGAQEDVHSTPPLLDENVNPKPLLNNDQPDPLEQEVVHLLLPPTREMPPSSASPREGAAPQNTPMRFYYPEGSLLMGAGVGGGATATTNFSHAPRGKKPGQVGFRGGAWEKFSPLYPSSEQESESSASKSSGGSKLPDIPLAPVRTATGEYVGLGGAEPARVEHGLGGAGLGGGGPARRRTSPLLTQESPAMAVGAGGGALRTPIVGGKRDDDEDVPVRTAPVLWGTAPTTTPTATGDYVGLGGAGPARRISPLLGRTEGAARCTSPLLTQEQSVGAMAVCAGGGALRTPLSGAAGDETVPVRTAPVLWGTAPTTTPLPRAPVSCVATLEPRMSRRKKRELAGTPLD